MTPAGTSSSLKRVTVVGMFHTSQCVKVPPGASGSVISSAKLCAVCGTFVKSSGGVTFAPLQVYFCGIEPPLANAGLVIVIAPLGGGGSETLPAGGTFLFAFMQERARAKVRPNMVRARAKRVRVIG